MNTDDRLDQIGKISQNARSTWFGLLIVLLFVGITLMGHKDSDFFAFGASTTLPVVNVNVPPTSFFLAAPILTAALYCYLQVYLLGLWDALGEIEQEPGAAPIGDRVYPTIYTVAGLLYRDHRRGDHSMPPRDLGRLTVIIAILLGWGFGLVVLVWLWWRSAPAHAPFITVLAGICFWAALMTAIISLLAARGRLAGIPRGQVAGRNIRRQVVGVGLLVVISLLSYDRAGGGLSPDVRIIPKAYLDDQPNLAPGWLPFAVVKSDLPPPDGPRQSGRGGTDPQTGRLAALRRMAEGIPCHLCPARADPAALC